MIKRLPLIAGLSTTAIAIIGATVALCLGHLSEGTYVALLAGGVVGAPAVAKTTEKIETNNGK